jgi:hypothetical protein
LTSGGGVGSGGAACFTVGVRIWGRYVPSDQHTVVAAAARHVQDTHDCLLRLAAEEDPTEES